MRARSVRSSSAMTLVAALLFGVGSHGVRAEDRAEPSLVVPTGRLHAMAPTTLISSSLAPNAIRTIRAAGAHGLPNGRIRAVALTLMASGASGPTRVRLGDGPAPPEVPTLITAGPDRSAFAIVPVSVAGTIKLWNGAAAVHVLLQVTGWFSDGAVSRSNTAGLFTRLAGYRIASPTLAPGSEKRIRVAGVQDVGTAASAVLLRIRTTARGTGRLAMAPTVGSLKGASTLAYATGNDTDLALAKLAHGFVTIANRGSHSVKVAVAAVGRFSSGTDPHAFGDGLTVVEPVGAAASQVVGTEGVPVATAGIGDVPAQAVSAPPSLVLLRTAVGSPTATGGLVVDPEGSPSGGVESIQVRSGRGSAGLVLARPGQGDVSRFAMSSGDASVDAEAFAYFSGGTVIDPGLHRLDEAAQAALIDVQPGELSFSGVPDSLADLQPGDAITSPPVAMAPEGLLRHVVHVAQPAGDLVVHTSPGSIQEVYRQTDLSLGVGNGIKPIPGPDAGRPDGRRIANGQCRPSGWLIGARIGCEINEHGLGYDVTIGASIAADVQISLHIGHDDWFYGQLSAAATASLAFDSTTSASVTLSKSFETEFPVDACTFELPEIGVFFFCHPGVEVEASGTLSAGISGHATIGGSAQLSIDSQAGTSFSHSTTKVAGAQMTTQDPAALVASVVPQITWRLDESPVGIHAGIPLSLNFNFDPCAVHVTGSVGVEVGLSVHAFWLVGLDVSRSLNSPALQLHTQTLRNCIYWTGTIDYNAFGVHDDGASVERLKGTASGSLVAPTKAEVRSSGFQFIHVNGSGVDVLRTKVGCGNPPHYVWNKQTDDWGGDFTANDTGTPSLTIIPANDLGRWLVTMSVLTSDGLTVPGERSTISNETTPEGGCKQVPAGPTAYPYWSRAYGFVDPRVNRGFIANQFYFDAPVGTMSVGGHRSVTDASGFTYRMNFILSKHCTTKSMC